MRTRIAGGNIRERCERGEGVSKSSTYHPMTPRRCGEGSGESAQKACAILARGTALGEGHAAHRLHPLTRAFERMLQERKARDWPANFSRAEGHSLSAEELNGTLWRGTSKDVTRTTVPIHPAIRRGAAFLALPIHRGGPVRQSVRLVRGLAARPQQPTNLDRLRLRVQAAKGSGRKRRVPGLLGRRMGVHDSGTMASFAKISGSNVQAVEGLADALLETFSNQVFGSRRPVSEAEGLPLQTPEASRSARVLPTRPENPWVPVAGDPGSTGPCALRFPPRSIRPRSGGALFGDWQQRSGAPIQTTRERTLKTKPNSPTADESSP